jgi:AcrR family transcriptional regulator
MTIVNNDSQMPHISQSDVEGERGAARGRGGHGGYPRKRARTRRHLLDAGIAAIAEHGPTGLTVGDIAARAGVASGTFYNHFPSLPHLVDAVTDELAGGVEIARSALEQVEHDPAGRVAIGTRQLLRLIRADPPSARAFVSLLVTGTAFRTRVRATVRAAIDDGIQAGRFVGRSTDVTTDAVLGTVVQWMRSALEGEAGPEPEPELLRMVLLVVGLPEGEVAAVLEGVSTRRVPTA